MLDIGHVQVLSLELWDDVNWLWPFIVQAFDECQRLGVGECFFPSQPIRFHVSSIGSTGQIRVLVEGGSIRKVAIAQSSEIFPAVAQGALAFFAALHKICPSPGLADKEIIDLAQSWIRD